jgi:putative ABC transport system permease protein
MLKNYFKVAFRYLAKHKGYTFINVLGLAVGIASCILVMIFVRSEWSFDRFHSKADRIHRAWLQEFYQGEIFTNVVTPLPLGPVLQDNLAEVETTCRVFSFNALTKFNNNTFNDPVNMVDSTFFNIFDFSLKEGDMRNPFPTSNSIIISQATAKKYFGNAESIGKNLELQLGNDKVLFTVSGVLKNIPIESSIQFAMLIPFSNAPRFFSQNAITKAWSNVSVETYILLKKGTTTAVADSKIPAVMQPLVAKNYKPGEYNVRLQPIADIHLNNALPAGNQPISDPKYSYILATIGILILLIACVNFVTLSIGRSTTRALEVGIRKVLGAERQQLIRQYWGEALMLSFFSLLTGIALAIILLKPFNQLADKQLAIPFDGFTLLFYLSIVIIIGLIAGIYPAIVLSGFKPIQVLKGKLKAGANVGFLGKALVTGQFVASIIMIIATITIGKQLKFLRSKDLGYNKEHIIIIPTNKPRLEGNQLAVRFKTAIEKNPQVVSSTNAIFSMAESGWMTLGYSDDKDVFRQFRINAVDADFVKTMGLKIIAGRDFMKDNLADSNNIIVNEAMVKEYGWKDPIGQKLPGKYQQPIIGVVKDFHFESLHTDIKPVMLALKPDSIRSASSDVSSTFSSQPRISVRLRGGNLQSQIEFLKASWKSVAGDQDFEFRFLDDALSAAYSQEQRLGNMVRYASVLSIFIACMGLFGLATLIVVKRTKEIGIRKVLGASVSNIVGMLSKDFLKLIIVAALVAFPIAWWGLHKWLEDFVFRIGIAWWIFILAGVVTALVAVITISLQAVKAATTNPVKNLRTE